MRIAGYIPHPVFKITIMQMNNRYVLKFEVEGLEQSYKFREGPLTDSVPKMQAIVDEEFLSKVDLNFRAMADTKYGRLKSLSEEE